MYTQDIRSIDQPPSPLFLPRASLLDLVTELAQAIGRKTRQAAKATVSGMCRAWRYCGAKLEEADRLEREVFEEQEKTLSRYQGFYFRGLL